MPVGRTDTLQALAASVDGQLLEVTVDGGVRPVPREGAYAPTCPSPLSDSDPNSLYRWRSALTAGWMQGSEMPGPRVQHGQWFCSVGVHPQRHANVFDFLSQGIAVYFTY